MYDWVRVLNTECNIVYVNKAMAEYLEGPVIGKKYYEAFNKSEPCENCVSRKSLADGGTYEKEEVIGDRYFSVMSSPVKDSSGQIIGIVEVFRDITKLKHLQKKIMEQNDEMQDDLDMARRLQLSMLPSKLPERNLKISFIYKPSKMLGGDFIDVFEIDRDHWGMYIADVSGHGVLASLFTVFLRSTIDKNILSPAETLTKLYKEFNKIGFDTDLYITVFYSVININTMELTFSNAGHNVCPVIFGNSGFKILRKPGIPISNWMDNPGYTDSRVCLNKGDRVFYSSDGIVEIKNSLKQQFGEERLLDILLSEKSEPCKILENIVARAFNFAGIKSTDELEDDITMALLEII
ncbi:MAG: SpoIIE family protein phosphatase [Clostridiaceae bacterium]|nr:SpoIIE family protein phosphatase [Clostridiaceae bacterium]